MQSQLLAHLTCSSLRGQALRQINQITSLSSGLCLTQGKQCSHACSITLPYRLPVTIFCALQELSSCPACNHGTDSCMQMPAHRLLLLLLGFRSKEAALKESMCSQLVVEQAMDCGHPRYTQHRQLLSILTDLVKQICISCRNCSQGCAWCICLGNVSLRTTATRSQSFWNL